MRAQVDRAVQNADVFIHFVRESTSSRHREAFTVLHSTLIGISRTRPTTHILEKEIHMAEVR